MVSIFFGTSFFRFCIDLSIKVNELYAPSLDTIVNEWNGTHEFHFDRGSNERQGFYQ